MTFLRKRLTFAFIAALAYGVLGYLLIWLPDVDVLPFISGLILLPMGIGTITTCLANPHGEGGYWSDIFRAWIVLAVGIVLSALVFGEGILCLVIASPLLVLFSAIGAAIAHRLLRRWAPLPLSSTFCALPLAVMALEPLLSWGAHSDRVTTVIEIAAPPQVVWAQTTAIPTIAPQELPFTVSHALIGLPRPIDAILPKGGPGAVRQLRWTQGIHFQEIITRWEPARALSWTFRFDETSIPDAIDRHIQVESRYLHLVGGGYVLQPLANGHTRLTLTTDYTLATPFNAYFSAWGDLMLNDFHKAVLTVIKARSEAL